MPVERVANAEPLPGYRLIEPLGKGGFGEVWKCQAPGGFLKAIKFVGGTSNALHDDNAPNAMRQEMHALHLLRSLRHPFLLSVERVEVIDGELLILTELADCSLHDLLERYQRDGHAGIPRDELLDYFREAAEVLDLLNQEHGLQHLDVKPRNLFLVGKHVKVGDFGLVGSLAESFGPDGASKQLEMVSPLYASPERFMGKVTLFSDQYSLAVSYVELLTGRLPFEGKNFRTLAMQHTGAEPDLTRLPESDRASIRKALAKEPRQRYISCLALIYSLISPGSEGTRVARTIPQKPAEESGENKKPATKPDLRLGEMASTAVVPQSNTMPAEQQPEHTTIVQPAPTDPLAGWQYLDCTGRFAFGEFWQVRPPDGPDDGSEDKIAKLVFGFEPAIKDASGREPLDRLRKLNQPGVVPMEFLPTPGRLILLAPYFPRSLAERFQEAVADGQAGIPREELLGYLGTIADLLDFLRERPVNLRHLGLNPRHLVLDADNNIQLADLGVVELVWKPAGQDPAALNTRYAAPELFLGAAQIRDFAAVMAHADQYAMALIFGELLTGGHPFRNLNQRQMGNLKTRGVPDLSMVPARDRPVLQMALDVDPRMRFRSCRELVDALSAASNERVRNYPGTRVASVALPPLMRPPAINRVLRTLTEQAAGPLQVREFGQQRFLLTPGERISHHCFARLVSETMPLKLHGFREQWQAKLVAEDIQRFEYHVRFAPSFLERLMGRQPGIETRITIEDIPIPGATLASVHIELRPISCNRNRGTELLEEMGPVLLESLRNFLQAAPERRKQERFPFAMPVSIYPLLADDELGEPIAGNAHDVSLSGLGVYLPRIPNVEEVAIHLRVPNLPGYLLVGQVVRQGQCRDGRHDLGLCFFDPLVS